MSTATNLRAFRQLNREPRPVVKRVDNRRYCERVHMELLSISDRFEILFLTRQEIKKLTVNELQAVGAYGKAYIKDYDKGRYLFRQNKRGLPEANLEEAEAYGTIVKVVANIEEELKRRF